MNNNDKPKYVTFIDKQTEDSFEKLKEGKFEDKKLYGFIERTISDLKKDPSSGAKIEKTICSKI